MKRRKSSTIGAQDKMKFLPVVLLAIQLMAAAFARCTEGDCADSHGLMMYEDGCQYLGECKSGKHGEGAVMYADGETCFGGYNQGDKVGIPNRQRILTCPDNSTNKGTWKDGLFVASTEY